MGVVLQKSSYSPNIRERLDASCAIFTGGKQLIAQAEHIPVHLGSMHMPLKFFDFELQDGDQIILNDPSMGGTHLPDITIYKPVFFQDELVTFVGTRAHHADIGGSAPGSIPSKSTEIYQEGLIIPPVKIQNKGNIDRDILTLILANTRTPYERRGDLMAQIGANNHGAKMVDEFIFNYGKDKYHELEHEILDYTRRMVEQRKRKLPRGIFEGKDVLELGGSKVRLNVKVEIGEDIKIDFNGTSEACMGNINAPLAVTYSAVYFFFRTILGSDIPINSAFYDFFTIKVPKGSLVNPPKGKAVVGGNVETSQRIVDALLIAFSKELDLPAQSHGTMNNISFGNSRYTFYETLGGGAGAGLGYHGGSGVHVYMTNTKNTPVEVMEASYPIMCRQYSLRHGSGGGGKWQGGEGIVKHYQALEPCTFSIISDRREVAPKGSKGGGEGAVGKNSVILKGIDRKVGGKETILLDTNDEVIILTPGGGGYGMKEPQN